ncbi:putative bifunctional diguanylate cyclase/phosphodiesterase [Sphingomonas sp. ID0503]|uniref:putative bifunctional diguanylate cyclase/phosphodiesterase n=1 Tax=Sphingomonas sp. ID0503 TaxID=3399691 RepID=UPI003AFB6E79
MRRDVCSDQKGVVAGVAHEITRLSWARVRAVKALRRAAAPFADEPGNSVMAIDAPPPKRTRRASIPAPLVMRPWTRDSKIALRDTDDALYRGTADLGSQIPWSTDPEGNIVDIGSRFLELTGCAEELALESGATQFLHPDEASRVGRTWQASLETGNLYDMELRLRTSNGAYRWHRARAAPWRDDLGSIKRWFGVFEDIHERRAAELARDWATSNDLLTGLLNRLTFAERLEEAVTNSRAGAEALALMLLDIDGFNEINSQHGMETGDHMLRQFADRIRINLSSGDFAGRTGADEFAIVISPDAVTGEIDGRIVALAERLAEPIAVSRTNAAGRASIGIATHHRVLIDGAELMRSANLALREAKRQSHHRIRSFESGMRADLQRRSSMLAVARRALRQKQIVPYYQPRISISANRVEGFEALLRIRGFGVAPIGPDLIAAAFDEPELAVAITDRMLDLVTRDIAKWRDRGIECGTIGINVTTGDLRGGNFPERVFRKLKRAGLPMEALEVEVTEGVLLHNDGDDVDRALGMLARAGMVIALDDFGTGFASLTHLQKFPVDVIKIDKRFIRNLVRDADDAAIVRAIIDLSRNLSLGTVAEGVETQAQLDALAEMGCEQVQGFFVARPMPASEVPTFLSAYDLEDVLG